jgi:hypothetical protein
VTTFRALVRVEDGVLHTSRPMTAPEPVSDLIESLVYAVTSETGSVFRTIDLEVETVDVSETPVGDSISATSSTPLGQHEAPDDGDDDELDVPLSAPSVAGQQ